MDRWITPGGHSVTGLRRAERRMEQREFLHREDRRILDRRVSPAVSQFAMEEFARLRSENFRLETMVGFLQGSKEGVEIRRELHTAKMRMVELEKALTDLMLAYEQHGVKTAIQHFAKAHEKEAHAKARAKARHLLEHVGD